MILQMKEGYLDVIDEMTTGTDLVSQMLPDAQRGVMALYKMSMHADELKQGGALRRGFITMDAGAGYTDMASAMQWKAGGLSGQQGMTKLVKNLLNMVDRSGGAQDLTGTKSAIGREIEEPRPYNSGGLIPGAPSAVDNKLGVVGEKPIGLAGGEYIVNAKQTQKFMPLLEMINSGNMEGYAGGGITRDGQKFYYSDMGESELGKLARAGDKQALVELKRRASAGDVWAQLEIPDKLSPRQRAKREKRKENKLKHEIAEAMSGAAWERDYDRKQKNAGYVPMEKLVDDPEQAKKFRDAGIRSGEWTTKIKQESDLAYSYQDASDRLDQVNKDFEKKVLGRTTEQIEADETRMKYDLIKELDPALEKKLGIAGLGLSGGGQVPMRIGALYLNGKVIGQDISSGPSEELKMAMQNANG
jgi:hypothetical protein